MDNMWIGTRTGNNKYIVTVKDWSGLHNLVDGHTIAHFDGLYNDAMTEYRRLNPMANDEKLSKDVS
jgi:hypothetical protein